MRSSTSSVAEIEIIPTLFLPQSSLCRAPSTPLAPQALARWITVARCIASSLAPSPAVIAQDVAVGDPAGTLTVEPGDTVQVTYSLWTEDPAARGEPGALLAQKDAAKVELVPDAAPRGLIEGVAGMRRGGKRFIAVPARAVCVGAPLPNSPEALFFLVSLNRIKKGSKGADGKSPSSSLPSRSTSPTPQQQQQGQQHPDEAVHAHHADLQQQQLSAAASPQPAAAGGGGGGGSGLTTPQVSRPNSPRRVMANMMMNRLPGCVCAPFNSPARWF